MQIQPEQFASVLAKGLAPVYLISGDEPLQQGEAADAVRRAASNAGFDQREVFQDDAGFSWNEFMQSADSFSVFSDRKILDLRLKSSTPGPEGAKVLTEYCRKIPGDKILLVTMGKLAPAAFKSRWFQALSQAGVALQVRPLEGEKLLRWLERRMRAHGIGTEEDGLRMLASRVEGNLLAAAQEIEKLYVLFGAGTTSADRIREVVFDSSRYDVYKLVDAAVAGHAGRMLKILQGLRAEGAAAPVILWALTKEVRLLAGIKLQIAQGSAPERAFKNHGVWESRKRLLSVAVNKLSRKDLNFILLLGARIDRQIKGEEAGDPWESLLDAFLLFAGVRNRNENV
ncbi:MAG: DNA polymerase III subunit delta [Gammaproteobacteria bacterium]